MHEKLMQDDTLTGTLSSVDVATKENLENLVKVGEELLKKQVSRVNLATGVFEPINKMTNEEALRKYKWMNNTPCFILIILLFIYFLRFLFCWCRMAKLLSKEKHLRAAKSAVGNNIGRYSCT